MPLPEWRRSACPLARGSAPAFSYPIYPMGNQGLAREEFPAATVGFTVPKHRGGVVWVRPTYTAQPPSCRRIQHLTAPMSTSYIPRLRPAGPSPTRSVAWL